MKNIKKYGVIAAILALTLALTACGGGNSGGSTSGGGDDADKTIKVAATPAPHAEILESVKEALAAEGWTLEIQEFDDYVLPNQAVTDGEVDANYFQHQPYLDSYNAENGTDIVNAAAIHYEPLGVYKAKKDSFDAIAEGDKIGVPDDPSNEARALQLLAANGLIVLKDGVGLEATVNDITDYPKGKLEIIETEAVSLPKALPDLELAVINGNYAIGAGLTSADAIAFEASDSEAAQTYANIIACANGNENSEKVQALIAALKTDAVKKFIEEKYGDSVKVMF